MSRFRGQQPISPLPSPVDVPQRATAPPQRTRIDWGAAKAFYVALRAQERSFSRVAREYRVTAMTVRKHAHREGWVELAAELDRRGAARAMSAAQRTIDERNARTVQLTEALRDRAIDKIEEVSADVAVRSLPRYLPIEQLIAGEATARVEVGDVQAIVTAVFTVAGRFVPADRRAEFMAELDGAVGGLVAIESGKAAAA